MQKSIANIPVFNYMDKSLCTGCEVCANVCPKDCISMIPDEEGFLFPYGDMRKCIHCNKCIRSCPVQNISLKNLLLESYAGYTKDENVLRSSASGGMFSLLINAFNRYAGGNGYIDGVVWDDDYYNARHIISNKKEEIKRMKSSKYIQSIKGNIYQQIQQLLDKGEYVMFSGTPCEAAGLKSFLSKEYSNLFIIDIVCQGPTSSLAMRQFINSITNNGRKHIKSLNMRHVKVSPWIPQWIKIDFDSGKSWCRLFYETAIGRSMHIMQRSACYSCQFNGSRRCSDITIGDYHGANPQNDYYNEYGTSIMIVNTEKGKALFNLIDNTNCKLVNMEYDKISTPNPRIQKAGDPHPFRENFGEIFIAEGLNAAANASWTLRQKIRMRIPYSVRLLIRKIMNK